MWHRWETLQHVCLALFPAFLILSGGHLTAQLIKDGEYFILRLIMRSDKFLLLYPCNKFVGISCHLMNDDANDVNYAPMAYDANSYWKIQIIQWGQTRSKALAPRQICRLRTGDISYRQYTLHKYRVKNQDCGMNKKPLLRTPQQEMNNLPPTILNSDFN